MLKFLFFAMGWAWLAPSWVGAQQTLTGTRCGDLTLPNLATGQAVSLAEFRGRKVLLIQFASW